MHNNIFLSYSKKDRFTANQIENLISNITYSNNGESPLNVWSMKSLLPGEDYDKKIKDSINNAEGVVLALSEEFFKAPYILDKELPLIKKKLESDPDFKIFPLLVRECDYQNFDLIKNLQIFPSPSKPIDHLGDDFDDEILDFVKKIKLSFEKESHNLELLTLDKGNSLSVPELQSIPWEKIKNQLNKKHLISNLVKGNPNTQLFVGQNSMKYFIPTNEVNDDDLKGLKKLKFITILKDTIQDVDGVSLLVNNKDRMEVFYDFVVFTNQKLGSDGAPSLTTLKNSVQLWRGLLSQYKNQDQLERGLIGELWVLNNLIDLYGPRFVEYWIGPTHQRHDFRFDDVELEIKTTNSKDRTHTISSVEQLEATDGSKLYLISILLTSTTKSNSSSISVHDLFLEIQEKLEEDHNALFVSLVRDYLLDPDLYNHFNTPYALTDIPKIILVNEEFPKISLDEYHNLKAHERIRRITYALNVDNLGEEFNKVSIQKALNL
jgi:hypothetical protein